MSMCQRNEQGTTQMIEWAKSIEGRTKASFDLSQAYAQRLGAHLVDGIGEIGFWVPELLDQGIPADQIYLEVFRAKTAIDFELGLQEVEFEVTMMPMALHGEYAWLAVDGLIVGSRHVVGDFYWLKYRKANGEWDHVCDPMPYSVPFGVFAPAEFYDMASMQAQRKDTAYFEALEGTLQEDGLIKKNAPVNLLQLHTPTATEEGTLRGLAKVYQQISDKLAAGEALAASEKHYVGYDALQLLPIEPTIEYENGQGFWTMTQETEGSVGVTLKKPDIINWGYDIVIAGMSAINPCLLGSKRPDELMDLIGVLHNFSAGPIELIVDVVYGHSDNQGALILNEHFFAGQNMYGLNMNFRQTDVRAILLEMQRRKSNYGVDGIRVDGAQDFKYWDADHEVLRHDDDYLQLMSDVVIEVPGRAYYPWMIFEDGRPWPRQDWELASSYRSVIDQQGDVSQWGPLTFAHNTPFLYTFWMTKWWRVKEILSVGSHWITGCSNHDTLRRGGQVETEERINDKLGSSYIEILNNAYDNPAEKMLTYGMFPGQPMDFINASMHAPWSFVRNTDDRYGVKIVAEERGFLDWQVDEDLYADGPYFQRLKAQGFESKASLYRFMHVLANVVEITDYDLEQMVVLMKAVKELPGPDLSVESLKAIAKDWMEDVHDYANVSYYLGQQNSDMAQLNLDIRNFRRQRPWLMDNLSDNDYFDYRDPTEGTVLYYGLRNDPNGGEQVLFVANMEGVPVELTPADLPIPALAQDGWSLAITCSENQVTDINAPISLMNSEAIIFTRLT